MLPTIVSNTLLLCIIRVLKEHTVTSFLMTTLKGSILQLYTGKQSDRQTDVNISAHDIAAHAEGIMSYILTLKVLVTTIDAQWEGMGDVESARYEPALLPPCPTIRVLSYSN